MENSCIFLPALANRNWEDGVLNIQATIGYYWSSTPITTNSGIRLRFTGSVSEPDGPNNKGHAFSIRCVR